MNSKQITFKEGASLNKAPLFEGDHFSFWQARMQIFIQSTDPGAWNAVLNGPHAPTKIVEGKEVPLQWEEMTEVDKQKVKYDLKARNIITSGLSSDEFFRTIKCKSAKEIWEMLEITHEETLEMLEITHDDLHFLSLSLFLVFPFFFSFLFLFLFFFIYLHA